MYNIGIDLGGTNIAAAIVKDDGLFLRKESIPTKKAKGAEAIVYDMACLALNLMEQEGLKLSDINSVGIGSPGAVDFKTGTIIYNNTLQFKNVPLVDMMKEYINRPIFIENDANAAAFGEYIGGAGSNCDNMVLITLGTGIGAGIVLDGKIINGSFGAGGELGHMVIDVDGEPCSCGRYGCWEAYSSATALIRDAKFIARDNPGSLLSVLVHGDINKIGAKTVFDASDAGDYLAKSLVERFYKYLAVGLVNVINILQPKLIVIGGGISGQGDILINNLIDRMKNQIYGGPNYFMTNMKIADLGNDAGLIGAAMLYTLGEK